MDINMRRGGLEVAALSPEGEEIRPWFGYQRREAMVPYTFLLPSFLALAVVFFYPMIHAIVISFYSNNIGSAARFIGWQNYRDIIASDWFPSVMKTSVAWTVGNVVFVCGLSLAIALMLDRNFPGRGLVRALFFLPWAVPYVAAGIVWGWMYDYEFGVLNYLVHATGLASDKINFLTACPPAFYSVGALSIWKLVPFGTVMFLAGLQTIPSEYYEAAKIDGAGPIQAFRYVTLPGLRGVTVMLTLLIAIWSFGWSFTAIFLLTEGGPAGCTETIVVRSYLEAFKFFRVGTASAIGTIVLLLSLTFSAAYLALVYRKGRQQ
ncbi:sugar ABC transporter permease [Sinorhizobium sp. 8-89]|uniref:carbohydrate ABC transporter permease n=1 Tax=Sinorhizobium sp. 7-81 TaxID=3049087 RepID=UPI0024C25025|nr:sugar ABC transporter permease [Sinorhizobium sp. 7-81]MDK1389809.1 sugar ABC transporter permease [Sinorhizobium sp. 7-81]